jgi:hypothetical protein
MPSYCNLVATANSNAIAQQVTLVVLLSNSTALYTAADRLQQALVQ